MAIADVVEAKQRSTARRFSNKSSNYKEKQQTVEQPRFSGKYQVGTWRKYNGQWVVRVVFNLGRMPSGRVMVLKANGQTSYAVIGEALEIVPLDEHVNAGFFAVER